VLPPVKAGPIWSAPAAAFPRCDLGGDHPPGNRLTAPQLPGPRRGPDDHTEPTAADIPAVDAHVNSGELITAQLPQVFTMHDARHGSQVRSCSREPPRGNQDLGRGQDAHQDSMGTCGARLPPPRPTIGHWSTPEHLAIPRYDKRDHWPYDRVDEGLTKSGGQGPERSEDPVEAERRLADPPATWQEHWFDHRQLLRLYHCDEHCAIYVDPDVRWAEIG